MILDEILERKEAEVADLRADAGGLRERAAAAPPTRSLAAALREGEEVAVIAEFKRRSPSVGAIAPDADPADVARAYAGGGARALSVLTDGPGFGGSLDDLARARAACELPVLRKDFLIDPVQALEARAAGADAAHLIVRALEGGHLGEMKAACREAGLETLVEVHDEAELDRALEAGAEIVGVNARDLTSFQVDLDAALDLLADVPADRVAVAESGIRSREDVGIVGQEGGEAVLVGTWLMEEGDPGARVRELTGRLRRPRGDSASRAGGG